MLSSLARFTVTLALASSVLGAAIPVTTVTADIIVTATPLVRTEGPANDGALWKNNVHYKIFEAPAPTAIAEGRLAPSRRSGNIWKGREHEVVDSIVSPSRRSGELWKGREHQEVARDGLAPSRRSGELWKGIEHEEVTQDGDAPSRRSGELWEGIEHEEVARDGGAPSRRSGELWRGLEHVEVSGSPDA